MPGTLSKLRRGYRSDSVSRYSCFRGFGKPVEQQGRPPGLPALRPLLPWGKSKQKVGSLVGAHKAHRVPQLQKPGAGFPANAAGRTKDAADEGWDSSASQGAHKRKSFEQSIPQLSPSVKKSPWVAQCTLKQN